jgi:CRISPR/Cas system-associated exonuclease Cas4 (RecB family)
MTPFLYQIAKIFHGQYGDRLYTCTFVFPNRRAGIFFQKHLSEIAGKPMFSPTILTIQELFESFSPYRPSEKVESLVLLHKLYGEVSGSDEPFDDFLYWGEMLLSDFNDVDKYLVDARDLFRNVHDYRLLDDDMGHLSEQQVKAIRRFWSHFMPVEGNRTKERFQKVWEVLYELYTSFREALHAKEQAYEGMMFREVVERGKSGTLDLPERDHYVFVGLNALTPSEAGLMEYLKKRGQADFYWDYESPLVRDEKNRASSWVKENLSRFPSRFPLDEGAGEMKLAGSTQGQEALQGVSREQNHELDKGDENGQENGGGEQQEQREQQEQQEQREQREIGEIGEERKKTRVEAIGVPSGVGQAKQVSQLLSGLIQSNAIPDPGEAIQTAIVLPDETLLMPLLYSIPPEIGKINVTMGYSLSNTSIAYLIDLIAQLQKSARGEEGTFTFYHRHVKALLAHPLISGAAKEEAESLRLEMVARNLNRVSRADIPPHPLFEKLFTPVTGWQDIGEYLKSILTALYRSLTDEKMNEERPERSVRAIDLEREFIVQCYKAISRLDDNLQGTRGVSVETYFRLFKQLARGLSVAFRGEPLSGLQVMGVLETRAIDFDNLIILSFNEGVYPERSGASSFIPYTLRQGFGLPTREQQDSTYAYHFYRMISRAKRVFLLYDTRTEGMQTGEVSRYFYQLKYLYGSHFNLSERVVAYDVAASEVFPVTVTKPPGVMRKLNGYCEGGDTFLSASLINQYIDCPLRFYFMAVEGLSEEEEVRETIEADLFGSIFHRVMELIYSRFKGKVITPDVLNEMVKDEQRLTEAIEQAFARYYFKEEGNARQLVGQHYLVGEVLRSYVLQTLKLDREFTPFEYVGAEYRFNRAYRVNESLTLNVKGIIDRVDRVNGVYRIIDYKTGLGATEFKEVQQLFDASKGNRPHQILQVFLYGMFYLLENPGVQVSPAIYYLRSVYKDFDPTVRCDRHPVEDISVYLPEFKERLNALLEGIFNPSIPFTQTENPKNCEWCAFRELCER